MKKTRMSCFRALIMTVLLMLSSVGSLAIAPDIALAGTQVKTQTLCDRNISLQSWKGDYLHRPDTAQGVTTWNTGIGNQWTVECIDDGKISLKSWKGDYLHRPDTAQGVTTWNTGIGNQWTVEPLGDNKISLKSWKGDYLHRPDTAQGVTTWNTGIGNEWTVVLLPQTSVISISDNVENDGDWTAPAGSDSFFSDYGCEPTAGEQTLGMANTVTFGGTAFIAFNQELIPGEYTATLDVCDYTNFPYAEIGKVGITVGGTQTAPGTLLASTSSTKPTPASGETQQWTFNYTVGAKDPNLGEPIGFLIEVPVASDPSNVAFDNLKIEISKATQSLCDRNISLQSWKGDYLHRPDTAQGVTTWNTGIGNQWTVECIDDGKISLKSWKGDYLHRPDTAQGVTTWNTGIGNQWTVEPLGYNKISLKSWKGDYLHRPDTAQGVTTWNTGIGNEWTVVFQP